MSLRVPLAVLLPLLALLCAGAGAAGWVMGGWPGLAAAIAVLLLGAWFVARRLRGGLLAMGRRLARAEEEAAQNDADRKCAEFFAVDEWQALGESLRLATARIATVLDSQREFTANAAHELRTPLAALRVAGECALRQNSADAAALREAVGAMLEEAQRASALVDRLLTLARAESGRLPVETGYHNVTAIVDSLLEWLRPLAAQKSQRIVLQKDHDWFVWADPHLLRLGLENLLSNAIRYAPEESEILVRIGRRDAGGIAIEVLDEGPGIAEDEMGRLFDRFYRGKLRGGPGSGLGLSIARWGLNAFGAGLEVERRLEKGSVFRIICPEADGDDFTRNCSSGDLPEGEPDESWVSRASVSLVLARLRSSRSGISREEAARRQEQAGRGTLRNQSALPVAVHLLRVSLTPFNGVLIVAMSLSLILGQNGTASVMGLMVFLSVALRFWQERRCLRAIHLLERRVALQAKVLRPGAGEARSEAMDRLAPGDVVRLSPGDMVPADVRLLSASGLRVIEAAVTGNTHPVSKTAAVPESGEENFANICHKGTHVVSGGAVAVVYRTGRRTRQGKMQPRLAGKGYPTAFQRGMTQVSWMLLGWMGALLPVVFLLHGVLLGGWVESFVFALAVAVGLTPELLPMVVNVNLARAAEALARKGVITKSLPAVQGIGAMDCLCMDKTGTLTEDRPVVHSFGNWRNEPDPEVLFAACANALLQNSSLNSLDGALRQEAIRRGLLNSLEALRKRAEIPFDHERRRVSVLLAAPPTQPGRLVCKGAPEAVLPACAKVRACDGQLQDLTEQMRREVEENFRRLQASGLRLLAVAEKFCPAQAEANLALENEMVLLGWVAFQDPIKAGVKEALDGLAARDVRALILTGDSAALSARLAGELGLNGGVISGEEIRAMSDGELAGRLQSLSVVARVSPAEKTRIIRILHAGGGRVGFVGDGANDAAALREADVGLCTQAGADIARESADVILAAKDLSSLPAAVDEGRKAFGNMLKYIKITASSNFGNAVSVVIASFFLPFQPMRAVQLLAQNLLYDFAQFVLPWDRVDASFTARPRAWCVKSILRFMLVFGPVSSIFDLLTFGALWWGFGANSPERAALFHTGWFTVGLLTQLAVVHVLRTRERPIWRHPAGGAVLFATLLAAVVGLVLPYSALARGLGFVGLPTGFYVWTFFVVAAYAVTVNFVKHRCTEKWGEVL